MSKLMEEFFRDGENQAPNDLELTELAQMAENQLFLENRIKEIENLLETTKEALRLVQEVHIPEAMQTIGMKKFTLSNGYNITIKEDVYASIRKDFMSQAIEWLDDHNLGDIVKDKVEVDFGRGQGDMVAQLMKHCKMSGYNVSEKMSVHPMTLKAVVKEQMSHGIEFPEEFFSVGPITKAVIKK